MVKILLARLDELEQDLVIRDNGVKDELEPTTKNDLGVREFEEIVVEYPPEDLCIYPEYKGKPYFGIKYKENGEEIVGYGTYNPKVLSQYLRDYFISTNKNDLEVDCIVDVLGSYTDLDIPYKREIAENILTKLSSVTPQPRKGHWKLVQRGKFIDVCCSNCKAVRIKEYAYNYTIDELNKEDINECFGSAEMRFCPNCGCRMVDPQESEK